MQLLTFTIGSDLYAIESRRVLEVLPLVPARRLPRAPDYVRGVFTYRGRLVPMVDLAMRIADIPVRERLGTRVIVVDCPVSAGSGAAASFSMGLAAENVLGVRETAAAEAAATSPSGAAALDGPLGRLVRIDGRIVQIVSVERVLPPELAADLAAVEASDASAGPPFPDTTASLP